MHRNGTLFKNNGILLILGQRSASVGSGTSIHNPTWFQTLYIKALKFSFNIVCTVVFGFYGSCFLWVSSVQLDPFDISSLTNPNKSDCMVISHCERPPIPWVSFEIVMFCRHFVLVTHDALFLFGHLWPNKTLSNFEGYGESGQLSKNGWSSDNQTSNA